MKLYLFSLHFFLSNGFFVLDDDDEAAEGPDSDTLEDMLRVRIELLLKLYFSFGMTTSVRQRRQFHR